MFQHIDARAAISFAAATAPAVVGWKPGGWIVYDPKDGTPRGALGGRGIRFALSASASIGEAGSSHLTNIRNVI